MSAFYGQVQGMADTTASRRGSANSGIKASCQSWVGSIITRMNYVKDDLFVEIQIGEGSSFSGKSVFYGTLQELEGLFKRANK